MNVKEIGALREKKTEHTLTLTVEFDEPVSEAEAVERVLQRLADKPCVINPEKQPELKKEKKKSPAKIDWDKACALKLAGWPNSEIAAELHANVGTINNAIYKHLNEYKQGKREGRCEEAEENEEA